MKKLKKLDLKQFELKDDEMKALVGGKIIYNCIRTQKYDYTGAIFYKFSTDSLSLAESWCAFWESADWTTTIIPVDDGSDEQSIPYYYVSNYS